MNNYDEISARMEEGNVNRTIASTNMNATSSRAHTIVGIKYRLILSPISFHYLRLTF